MTDAYAAVREAAKERHSTAVSESNKRRSQEFIPSGELIPPMDAPKDSRADLVRAAAKERQKEAGENYGKGHTKLVELIPQAIDSRADKKSNQYKNRLVKQIPLSDKQNATVVEQIPQRENHKDS